MHLDTSLKHLNMDWRGGTWKQIRMYTKSNSQLLANNYLLSVQSLNPGQCRKSPDHKLGKLLGIQNLLQLSILKLLLNIMLPLQWEEFKSFLKTITEYGSSRHGSVIKESD